MCSPGSAPDVKQPLHVAMDEDQLQQIEHLFVQRLMNPPPASPADSASEPPLQEPQQQPPQMSRRKNRKRRRHPDERIEAFRSSVAQKVNAAQQAVLAIATVRPMQQSAAPPARRPPLHISSTSVATIKVKQLPPATPLKRSESNSEHSSSSPFLVDAAHFVNTHRTQIGDFGSQALDRRDRKKYDAAKRIKLGCRPPKNQKMPIGLLQKRRKREKLNAQRQKERNLATGMLLRTKRR